DPAVVNKELVIEIEEREPPPQPIAPHEKKPALDFLKREDVERWLADKPLEWAIVIAARSALRSIPALASEARTVAGGVGGGESTFILPAFRGVCAAWVAANSPSWRRNSDLAAAIHAAKEATFKIPSATNSAMAVSSAISIVATPADGS